MHPSLKISYSTPVVMRDRYQALVHQWMLRLLIDAHGYRFMFNRGRFTEEDLLAELGIPVDELDDPSKSEVLRLLTSIDKQHTSISNLPDGQLGHNLQLLSDTLSLSIIELEILAFMVIKEHEPCLSQAVELFHQRRWIGSQQFITLISIALKRPRREISNAFSGDGTLRQCGLISPEDHSNGVDLLDGLDDLLLYEENGPNALFHSYTYKTTSSDLDPTDFSHLSVEYNRIRNYVCKAGKHNRHGINVLIYGAPGTGKTEMVRTIAAAQQMSLYEVKSSHSDGRPMGGDRRLSAYQMAQHMLASDSKSLLLFDEVEDVFNEKVSNQYKACINRILENNPRPSFWLSNSIYHMDPAYIRRFDLILQMPELDHKARLKITRKILKGINVSEEWMITLSERSGVHAAHLAQAARVVKLSGYRKSDRIESEIDSILASLYQALGYRKEKKENKLGTPYYNPALSNTDMPLEALTKGLKKSRMGRVCLYGPPGTGKSGYAQYVSGELNMLLISRKASDLLDKYLGGTEKALAQAFEEAKQQKGILLIDEADSFLAPRNEAHRSWEVTQVNELLVQMEQFDGILIMSTNFLEHIDSAALRRFDFKIKFSYLSRDQRWMMFNDLLGRANQDKFKCIQTYPLKERLDSLEQLTPGDFATVERRLKVIGEPLTVETLIDGLQKEHQVKTQHQGRKIGFT